MRGKIPVQAVYSGVCAGQGNAVTVPGLQADSLLSMPCRGDLCRRRPRPGAPGAGVHDGEPDASLLNVYRLPDAALDVAVTDIAAALAADPDRIGRQGMEGLVGQHAGLRGPVGAEERTQFFGVEFGFFEGCEVAAAGRFGEPDDVRGAFEPGPGRGGDVAGEEGEAGRHLDAAGLLGGRGPG